MAKRLVSLQALRDAIRPWPSAIHGIERSFANASVTAATAARGTTTALSPLSRPPAPSPPRIRSMSTIARHPAASGTPARSVEDGPLANSPIPIFSTVRGYRKWRADAAAHGKSVGFVATMGALHEGHLSLVQASLDENDYTVVSIFVNPAQFAPTEDLSSYPRTVSSDIEKLSPLRSSQDDRKVSAAFVPTVAEMYPSGFTQVVEDQVGAFVEVKGLGHQMEGGSRPTFFRGVATVVTKLFHIIQPDRTYFGQKDIQQAIVLRRLVKDLLFAHPPSPQHLRVMPTGRDKESGLALSSRNAYLTPAGREVAPILFRALSEGQRTWEGSASAPADERVRTTLRNARAVVEDEVRRCRREGSITLELDYISLNNPNTLENLEDAIARRGADAAKVEEGAILSGAALVREGEGGKVTRLIDNVLLGFRL